MLKLRKQKLLGREKMLKQQNHMGTSGIKYGTWLVANKCISSEKKRKNNNPNIPMTC